MVMAASVWMAFTSPARFIVFANPGESKRVSDVRDPLVFLAVSKHRHKRLFSVNSIVFIYQYVKESVMDQKLVSVIVLLFLLAIGAACSQPPTPLPTSVPVAELPSPTSTSLPPTIDFATLTSTPAPTAVSPTRPPTATPTPIIPTIGITSLEEGAEIVLGSDILVKGLVQRQEEQSVFLTLQSLNGRLLAEMQAATGDQNWEASFTVPHFVSGAALLQATIRDDAGETLAADQLPITLVIDTQTEERYLALLHPLRDETAVGGFNLFFDGIIFRPVDSAITISVWVDDCQTRVARQSFILGRSTFPIYWQGFTVIPQDIVGPGCAVVHTGEPDSDDWREVVMPINILPGDSAEAKGVRIGNPPANSHVTAGEELLLYGTAMNTSEKPVSVTVLMENGRIISQSTTPADYWGYWEFAITLPPDVAGPAKITVSAGEPDQPNYAEAEVLINVDPAPTPES